MKYNNCHCGSWKNEKYTYCYVCNIVNQIDKLIRDIHNKFSHGYCDQFIRSNIMSNYLNACLKNKSTLVNVLKENFTDINTDIDIWFEDLEYRKNFRCLKCGKIGKATNVRSHVEACRDHEYLIKTYKEEVSKSIFRSDLEMNEELEDENKSIDNQKSMFNETMGKAYKINKELEDENKSIDNQYQKLMFNEKISSNNIEMNKFEDIKNYIGSDHEYVPYTTKQVLDMINDKNIDREQLKGIRRSLMLDDGVNLSKLVKDHQWYIDQLNKVNTKSVSKTTKSTEKSIPKSVPRTTKSTENSSKKSNHMDEKDLEKLSKSELIKMLLKLQTKQRPKIIIVNDYKQVPKPHKSVKNIVKNYEDNIIPPPIQFRDDYKPVPLPRTKKQVPTEKPIPAPRKSVKEMVQKLEDNIILPPMKFRDKPIPLPRTKKQAPIEKPVPLPRTKITLLNKALKGFNKSFEISIKNYKDPLEQLQKTRKGIESNIKNELASMKGIKFIETLKITK